MILRGDNNPDTGGRPIGYIAHNLLSDKQLSLYDGVYAYYVCEAFVK